MQFIYPQMRPSPLAGLSEAAGTLAEAVIKSREKQALGQDTTLIGQALAEAQGGMTPPGEGDAAEAAGGMRQPGTRAQMINALSNLLPQMKSDEGKKMVSQALTKMIMAEKQDVTTFYDPDKGTMTQVPGRGVQVQREKAGKGQVVKVQEGDQEVTYLVDAAGNRTEIGRGPKWNPKEAKQVLLENEAGDLGWFPEGGEVPKSWTKPTSGGKKGFTGRTKEVVDFLNLMDLDPKKGENWKYAKEILGRGTDVSRWAMQQAAQVAKGDMGFSTLSPAEKKAYIQEQAKGFVEMAEEMKAGGQGGPGKAQLGQEYDKARSRVEAMPEGPDKEQARRQLASWKAKYLGN